MSEVTTKKTAYWKSLNELAQNEAYRKHVENEFAEGASEAPSKQSRRTFLELLGASVALAGLAACRRPIEKIVPYVNQPEFVVPGNPLFYATAVPMAGSVTGLLVETNEGRPIKVEGNPDASSSLGGTNRYHQAATLDLYDPDRSQGIRLDGNSATWDEFSTYAKEHFSTEKKILFISSDYASPTLERLKSSFLPQSKGSKWVTYEPFMEENIHAATKLVFGKPLRRVNHFDKASVILSIDDNFLDNAFNGVSNTKAFSKARRVMSVNDSPARLYVAESNFSVTGSMADHRFRLKNSQLLAFTQALATELSDHSALSNFRGFSNDFTNDERVKKLATDLKANKGKSIVTAGFQQNSDIHALVALINYALDNQGKTVSYHEVSFLTSLRGLSALKSALSEVKAGSYDGIVVLGTNPVFDAPADLEVKSALKSLPSIHLSSYFDETSRSAKWHINEAHFLESWGDGWSYTGEMSVIQPLIQPLHQGKSSIEILSLLLGSKMSGHEHVKETWKSVVKGSFDKEWKALLHEGYFKNSFTAINTSPKGSIKPIQEPASKGVELNLVPSPVLWDGRFANNAWLQELPEPISKITWDNVGFVSLKTAEKWGVHSNIGKTGEGEASLVTFKTTSEKSITAPVWVIPGHADDVVTLQVGFGRKNIARNTDGGVNAYTLSTSDTPFHFSGVSTADSGDRYPIACVQDHHSMEGRSIVREADLEDYRAKPDFAPAMIKLPGKIDELGNAIDLFNEQNAYTEGQPQWGMTIDLNSCTGCGVCTIACQAENNIPIVGKTEVLRGRELHWIRTDRYFTGDLDNPEIVHQPLACQHCEMAPCEQVCPVAATVHSEDGLNQMTYNRCVGTRYCANNCPYKVRRFNFFNYTKEFLTTGKDPEIIQMAMNPEVTIRFRGVMEKCTFCVQRINRGKIETKRATGNSRKPSDGTVKTACQQACPADAIQFGDITDKNSLVSKHKANERNYKLLEELNARPRLTYLAKIRNYNKDLAQA